MEIFTKNSAKCTVFQSTICNKFSSLMYDAKNGPTMCLQNIRANTHMFSDSEYDNTIEPYSIDMAIDTILINAARTQASHIPHEHWNQISVNGHTIWRKIPTEDHTIILEGCPNDTVSGLMDLATATTILMPCLLVTKNQPHMVMIPSECHLTLYDTGGECIANPLPLLDLLIVGQSDKQPKAMMHADEGIGVDGLKELDPGPSSHDNIHHGDIMEQAQSNIHYEIVPPLPVADI
jgi:hypothetical protein